MGWGSRDRVIYGEWKGNWRLLYDLGFRVSERDIKGSYRNLGSRI